MRHLWTIVAALCCTVFLTACESNESDGPDTNVVRTDTQTEIDRLLGGNNLVALDDLTITQEETMGDGRTIYTADWTGTVTAQGQLFVPQKAEQFGRDWLETHTLSAANGKNANIQGSVAYELQNQAWILRDIEVTLDNGKVLNSIGVAEILLLNGGSFLAGSPEAEARRQELQKAAQIEADKAAAATSKAQEYRAKREAEKQKMIEDRKKRKAAEAEAARKAKEAEGATQP